MYRKVFSLKYLLAGLLALGLTSCGGDDNDGFQFGESSGNPGTITPPKEITARMETPEPLTNGTTVVLSHSTKEGSGREVLTYSLEYDKAKYHSRWVAFRFDGDTRGTSASRSDEPFADDPSLASNLRIGPNHFGYPYQRGHLCASADRIYSKSANVITFYMSNMSPQMGPFNEGYWVRLEGHVQKLGRDASFADTLYVVKGGTVKDGQILDWENRVNGTRVAVPKYYYMALLKVKNGTYSSIAFWMEHKDYGYTKYHKAPLSEMKQHAVTVNDLEQKTGINFFPNLGRTGQKEETVESQLIPSNWGL